MGDTNVDQTVVGQTVVGQTTVLLAVVGAHLDGQPLNHQLADRCARLVRTTETAPCYRLFALETTPPKPGLLRVSDGDRGGAVEVEVWELGVAQFGSFVAAIPRPLGIGKVELADGSEVCGFICETEALDGSLEITNHGGWRNYLVASAG
jgi:allophanate hydrolase